MLYIGKTLIQSSANDCIKEGSNISLLTNDANYVNETQLDDATKDKIVKGSLGTINGQSIEDGNDVTLDLTLYKVVTELPAENIDVDKIYLVLSNADENGDNNVYTEYVYANGDWEILGQYKANVDLTPYLKSEDAANTYLSKTDAADTYLSKTDAADTYVTKTDAEAYQTKAALDTDVANLGYLKQADLPANHIAFNGNDSIPVKNVRYLTSAQYDAIKESADENTLYIVKD